MVFVYLSIGLLLVLLIHSALTFFANAKARTIRHSMRYISLVLVVLLVVLLLRFGLPHLAAIASFVAVVATLIQRIGNAKTSIDGARKKPANSKMDAREACEILGVPANASPQEIRDAHHRLIQKNHPDAGGTEYLASQINEARDVLLANHKDTKP